MVSETTQTFVREILDAQIDFNIKLIIFGCIAFYAFLLHRLSKTIEVETFAHGIFVFMAKIYVYMTVIYLPLFSIMLFREYSAIQLWTLVWQMYGGIFVIAALSLTIFGWQKMLSFVGITANFEALKRDRKRRGEE